jgi:pimeloyl-ACP methyl ester carboxylesterase
MYRMLALSILAVAACRPADQTSEKSAEKSANAPPAWSDASAHKESFVQANGARLNVLDWGGTGPALVLVHGYGDSPHVYDDIAPAFTNKFHVVSYARRGHGKSSSAESYSNASLAGDLITVMDSLGISKAYLAGWSMGGNEITAAAGTYPNRVEKMVYLDGAYDWSDSLFSGSLGELPISIDPPAEARTGIEAYTAWWLRSWWPGGDASRVDAYLRDIGGLQPDGTLHPVPDSANAARAFGALLSEHRDYRKVKAPSLAIYSDYFLPPQGKDSANTAAIKAWETKHFVPFRKASQARVRKELSGVAIATVPGSHGSFIFASRDSVVSLMTKFFGVK